MTFICVLTQDRDLCFFCGEWVHVEVHGGLVGPDDNRYCSQECIETLVEWKAAAKVSDWCPDCGYDRFEHGSLLHEGWCHDGNGCNWVTATEDKQ